MKFPKNNNIFYGQDMRFFQGIPSDINFDVEKTSFGWYLRSCGNGCTAHSNCYGNGSLAIYIDCLEENGHENLIKELDSCYFGDQRNEIL